jgi:peptidoglycan/LPS O-acetylase OafA/YrhL
MVFSLSCINQVTMNDLSQRARNNIGLLRLVLASAVIVGHAPELVDGTRAREPLTRLFGTMSLGEVAVDAFFILSGFLITQSLTHRTSVAGFISRRILRIYPAFLAAYLLSVYCLGALGSKPNHPLEIA